MALFTASGSATSSPRRSRATTSWSLPGSTPASSRPSCPPAPARRTLTTASRKGRAQSPHGQYFARDTPPLPGTLRMVFLIALPVFLERIIEFYQLARVLTEGLDGFDPGAQAIQ